MNKHTKTPIKADLAVKPDDGYVIELTANDGAETIGYATSEANAAFIVRAVNAHQELLARVRLDGNAYHQTHNYEKGVWPFKDCIHPECGEYRRLIEKAEGK